MTNEPVRVLIADEQALFREAVRAVLEADGEIVVVAEAGTRFHAISEAERSRPDVVVIDSLLPGGGGFGAAQEISERVPRARTLIISGQEHERTLLQAVEAGASGFMTKEDPVADLIEAVRGVVRGETVIPPRMLGRLLEGLLARREERTEAMEYLSRLTRREIQVLRLLVRGADNRAIGAQLRISPQTARTHVQNILAKLEVHSRLEAAAFVMNHGVLADEPDEPIRSRVGSDSRRGPWHDSDMHTVY